MRIAWRLLTLLALAAGLVYLPAQQPACACSCAISTPQQSFEYADLVFTGTVAKVDSPPASFIRSSDDPVTFTFSVDKVEKGDAPGVVKITSAMDSASCGMNFALGTRYRVYAAKGETGLCSGNVALGLGSVPPGLVLDDESPVRNVFFWLGTTFLAAVAAGIGYFLYRRMHRTPTADAS